MMRALTDFNESALVVQSLWSAQQGAARLYRRQLAEARQHGDDFTKQLASTKYRLWHALVQASAVRLTTTWEIFLQNLLKEYLARRPSGFKMAWRLQGNIRITEETVDRLSAARPFQDLGKARQILGAYLGDDLFGSRRVRIDLRPVQELIIVRNAIVHLGGAPTKQFRDHLRTRKSAHAYLLSRPTQKGTVPATHFERILTGTMAVASQLYSRAWERPRA